MISFPKTQYPNMVVQKYIRQQEVLPTYCSKTARNGDSDNYIVLAVLHALKHKFGMKKIPKNRVKVQSCGIIDDGVLTNSEYFSATVLVYDTDGNSGYLLIEGISYTEDYDLRNVYFSRSKFSVLTVTGGSKLIKIPVPTLTKAMEYLSSSYAELPTAVL